MRWLACTLLLVVVSPSVSLGQADELGAPRVAPRGNPGPRPPGTVRLYVESDDPNTRLFRTAYVGQGRSWRGVGRPPPGVLDIPVPILGEYQLLCEAPCVLDLPMGSYLFGVQEGEGRIRFRRGTIDNYVHLTRSGALRIDVPNTAFRRVLGVLLMIGGGLGFGFAMQKLDSGAPLIATTVSTGTLFMAGCIALIFPVMPTVEYRDPA